MCGADRFQELTPAAPMKGLRPISESAESAIIACKRYEGIADRDNNAQINSMAQALTKAETRVRFSIDPAMAGESIDPTTSMLHDDSLRRAKRVFDTGSPNNAKIVSLTRVAR
jgi:hypothetical protein